MALGRGVEPVGEEFGAVPQRLPHVEEVDVVVLGPGPQGIAQAQGSFSGEAQTLVVAGAFLVDPRRSRDDETRVAIEGGGGQCAEAIREVWCGVVSGP